MLLKCLRFIDGKFDSKHTLDLDIDLSDFYIKKEYVNVGKVLTSDFLFEPYYDSIIINSFFRIHNEQRFNYKDVISSESAQSYYRLVVLFFTLLEFIRQSKLSFNKSDALKKDFTFKDGLPSLIEANNAYYYLYWLINILLLRKRINVASDFYAADFVLSNGKYVLEDGYNDNLCNLFLLFNLSDIIGLFKKVDRSIASSEKRCVALLIYDDVKYLSISGTSPDYKGQIIKGWSVSSDYTNTYKCIKTDTIYNFDCECHLIDTCCGPINYQYHKNSIDAVKHFIQFKYACCERKILAYIPEPFVPSKAKLYVKFPPCDICAPYLEGMTNIICADKKTYFDLLERNESVEPSLRRCSIQNSKAVLVKIKDSYLE